MNAAPEKPAMTSAWLQRLAQQAHANRLEHIDLLLDATGLPAALPEPIAQQPNTRLFDGTPEQELAEQGPQLRRVRLDDQPQLSATDALLDQLGTDRVLVLLSAWPFETLSRHLRHATQASWGQGRHSGVLRFYDPRLFPLCCEALLPAQSDWFHAPSIAWYWRDSQGQPRELAGRPRRPEELPSPLPALNLSDTQLFDLVAWSEAVRFSEDYALTHRDLQLPSQEALHRYLVNGLRAAQREQVPEAQRDDFLMSWIEQQNPGVKIA